MKNPTSGIKAIGTRGNNAVLIALAMIAVGIQVIRFARVGPQLAAATAATPAAPPPVEVPHDVILTFAVGDIDEDRELMQHTEQVVQTIKSFPTTRPAETEPLKINPFKASRAPSISPDRVQQERADTMAAAQTMTLQSVMHSDLAPVCLINNVLLRERQQVNGFTVDEIHPDSVIIHRGIYRFELRLLK
jgi:hypothetical protein